MALQNELTRGQTHGAHIRQYVRLIVSVWGTHKCRMGYVV
jgi:hypothetical protein